MRDVVLDWVTPAEFVSPLLAAAGNGDIKETGNRYFRAVLHRVQGQSEDTDSWVRKTLHEELQFRIVGRVDGPNEKADVLRPDFETPCAELDGSDQRLLQWTTDNGVVALRADNNAVEAVDRGSFHVVQPKPFLPLHEHCLVKLGVYLGELWLFARTGASA